MKPPKSTGGLWHPTTLNILTIMSKKHVSMMLDERVVEEFKKRAAISGRGYQSLINDVLVAFIDSKPAVDLTTLNLIRQIVREEMSNFNLEV